jgi:beta-glucosidase
MDKEPGEKSSHAFPAQFAWGVATSSHQVEGGNLNNQWAAWEKQGRIKSGDAVGLACDWWRHAELDFDLAKQLGVNALRLSVEWSRIEPTEGQWNADALSRYRQMLLALQERGMRPFVTLHHFTNPLWLEAKVDS